VPVIAHGTSGAPVSSAPPGAAAGMAELVWVAHAGAFREEREEAALTEDLAGRLERVGVRLTAAYRERTEPHEQAAVACLDQLRLRHEPQVAARADRDEERVEEALVVGRDDGRTFPRHVLRAGYVRAEVEP
jgi:hypothetical protein